MKHKIFLFLLCLNVFWIYAQEQVVEIGRKELKPNELVYLFGNDVKLREQPTTDSEVLALMPISSELQFLETTSETYEINGVEYPWIKVQYTDQIGYIVSYFLAKKEVLIYGHSFVVNIIKDKLYLRTKNAHSELIEEEIPLKEDYKNLVINQYGDRRLENVKHVFEIVYEVQKGEKLNIYKEYIFYKRSTFLKISSSKIEKEKDIEIQEVYAFPDDENTRFGFLTYCKFYIDRSMKYGFESETRYEYYYAIDFDEPNYLEKLAKAKEKIEKQLENRLEE
ncbi:SH3 domain-containing protein [Aureivirga sp. CE67]|uniref:SH3 domain-containing protein n=1 Tax=Aureivirga sp. CE67 TaxID=1788983 RepID=UPI0018CADBBE|nr:SH3 domain-containing protein [Aureivirga sp. CE67]